MLYFGKKFTMRRAKSTALSGINSGRNAVCISRELHRLKHQIQVIVCVGV